MSEVGGTAFPEIRNLTSKLVPFLGEGFRISEEGVRGDGFSRPPTSDLRHPAFREAVFPDLRHPTSDLQLFIGPT
jgi:hypothetical protein